MENNDITDDLKELDAMFKEMGGNEGAEKMANEYTTIPDGIYDAEVIEATAGRSKKGLPMITIKWGIEDQPNKFQFLMLGAAPGPKQEENSRSSISRAVSNLRLLGLDAKDLTGYINKLDDAVGVQKKIQLKTTYNKKTDSEFQGVTILRDED